MEVDDADLVRRYRGGDDDAFRVLVERHRGTVYAVCFKLVGDREGADEMTQATFVRAFRRIETFEGRAAFRTWLVRIAVNGCRNRFRDEGRRRMEPLEDAPAHGRDALGEVLDGEVRRGIHAAVAALPDRQRAVVELRLFRDLPYREIASILGCREGTAKVNYHHAITKLRASLRGLRDATAGGVA